MTRAHRQANSLVDTYWNTSNHSPKPVIIISTDISQMDLSNSQYLVFSGPSGTSSYDVLSLTHRDKQNVVRIDINGRTADELDSLIEEVERILHLYRVSPGGGWGWMVQESDNDLSDDNAQIFRVILEYRFHKIGENIQ